MSAPAWTPHLFLAAALLVAGCAQTPVDRCIAHRGDPRHCQPGLEWTYSDEAGQ